MTGCLATLKLIGWWKIVPAVITCGSFPIAVRTRRPANSNGVEFITRKVGRVGRYTIRRRTSYACSV